MKRLSYITIILAALSLASCHDWLTESAPGTTDVKDFLSSEEAAVQQTNGIYVPLAWEFNNVFYGEWAIGDVCSDDAIKGGESIQNAPEIYDLSNFQTTSNNSYLLDFYRAQYQGIERANIAIEMIGGMSSDFIGDRMRSRLIAEAKFLRAYYYFRLVRIFGGVPLVIEPIYSSRATGNSRARRRRRFTNGLSPTLKMPKPTSGSRATIRHPTSDAPRRVRHRRCCSKPVSMPTSTRTPTLGEPNS